MKKYILLAVCLLLFLDSFSQKDSTKKTQGERVRQFWFVMLKTGPKTDADSATRSKLFEGHMSNMKRLYEEGILKAAGPFGKNDFTWRGLFVFDVKTKEEAEKIVGTDPAVAGGLLAADIVPWYTEPSGNFLPGKPVKQNK